MKKLVVLLMAVIMSVMSVFAAMAASSPHRPDPHPVIVDNWNIIYKNDAKRQLRHQTSKYINSYLDQLSQINPAAAAEMRAKAGSLSIQFYEGDRPDGIDDVLIYTDYPDRESIIANESRGDIRQAYLEIEAAGEHMEAYVPSVADKARQAGYAPEDCYVEDIFDLTYYVIDPNYIYSRDYKGIFIELPMADIKDNFICLLHRYNGKWQMVETNWAGDMLTFYVSSLSPFAVICAGDGSIMESDAKQSPRTGDNTLLWGAYAAGAAALILGAGYVLLRKRRHG